MNRKLVAVTGALIKIAIAIPVVGLLTILVLPVIWTLTNDALFKKLRL